MPRGLLRRLSIALTHVRRVWLVAAVTIAVALVSIVTKVVTGWYASGRVGAGPRGRMRAGTVLIARGEFSIVIAGLAVGTNVDAALGPTAAAYVLILAVLGPLLARLNPSLPGWTKRAPGFREQKRRGPLAAPRLDRSAQRR